MALPGAPPLPEPPDGCEVILLSPMEIHFSQTRMRAEFQDGNLIDEACALIQAIPLHGQGSDKEPASSETTPESGGEAASKPEGADGKDKDAMLMCHPFPRIEVTRWRCKLREPDGSPKVDPNTGLELYSHEERWFSFDNRRLCCLQRAAAKLYPTQVRCEVVEINRDLARTRELRKFDTRTFGCSIIVGRRDDPNPVEWSWRKAVGLPEEAQPEEGIGRQPSARFRGGPRGGPNSGRGGKGRNDSDEEEPRTGTDLMRSALLFVFVYLGLRVAVKIFKRHVSPMLWPLEAVVDAVVDAVENATIG